MYTHGYGVIASPMNVAGSDGLPAYFAKNIPVENQGINVDARGAQIYFGEQQGGYVIVNAKQPSLNYPRQGVSDSLTRYQGKDGVLLSSVLRKAAFALRFSDINLLISGQIRPESEDPPVPVDPQPGREARAVPALRRRPVSGGGQRTGAVGTRRVHDVIEVPVLAVLAGRATA